MQTVFFLHDQVHIYKWFLEQEVNVQTRRMSDKNRLKHDGIEYYCQNRFTILQLTFINPGLSVVKHEMLIFHSSYTICFVQYH